MMQRFGHGLVPSRELETETLNLCVEGRHPPVKAAVASGERSEPARERRRSTARDDRPGPPHGRRGPCAEASDSTKLTVTARTFQCWRGTAAARACRQLREEHAQ